MRKLMNLPRRYLLLTVVMALLLVSGISLAASRRASALTPVDCKSDCAADRDKTLEKCNDFVDAARDKCRERAQRMYDKCIEKCDGGGSSQRPGGF